MSPALARIEQEIDELPRREQLRLIERLVRRLREGGTSVTATQEQLAAMAADPEILRELRTLDSDSQNQVQVRRGEETPVRSLRGPGIQHSNSADCLRI